MTAYKCDIETAILDGNTGFDSPSSVLPSPQSGLMPSADRKASKRTRLTTVCVPNRIQHIPKPLKRAAGPSSLSRAPSRDIDEAEDDLAASDMMRTLMTSTGDEAAEHTKLYKE